MEILIDGCIPIPLQRSYLDVEQLAGFDVRFPGLCIFIHTHTPHSINEYICSGHGEMGELYLFLPAVSAAADGRAVSPVSDLPKARWATGGKVEVQHLRCFLPAPVPGFVRPISK